MGGMRGGSGMGGMPGGFTSFKFSSNGNQQNMDPNEIFKMFFAGGNGFGGMNSRMNGNKNNSTRNNH